MHPPVGVYCAEPTPTEQRLVDGACAAIRKKNGKIFVLNVAAGGALRVQLLDLKRKTLEPVEHRLLPVEQYLAGCVTVRVRGAIELRLAHAPTAAELQTALDAELERQVKLSRKVYFRLADGEFEMSYSKGDVSPLTELYTHLRDESLLQLAGSGDARAKMIEQLAKQRAKERRPLEFAFGQAAATAESTDVKVVAGQDFSLPVAVDCALLLDQSASIMTLAKAFEQLYLNTLNQAKQLIIAAAAESGGSIPVPGFHNFLPRQFTACFVNLLLPSGQDDKQLTERRRELCKELCLPTDRPLLRRSNQWRLALTADEDAGKPLLSVHTSLLQSPKGQVSAVTGVYAYYHYMQQGTNDAGWGCAYRSLQTLVSWFQLQGYVQVDRVPTHTEVQKVLVDIGDKPAAFVGSKQWIGSTEVGYVLNQLYAIESKFMYVGSGAELEGKGRELAKHFDTQGTPVMIGGGMLAHTILGVDFNENTGQLRFLVLDPHYTGTEELSTILNKVRIFIHLLN